MIFSEKIDSKFFRFSFSKIMVDLSKKILFLEKTRDFLLAELFEKKNKM